MLPPRGKILVYELVIKAAAGLLTLPLFDSEVGSPQSDVAEGTVPPLVLSQHNRFKNVRPHCTNARLMNAGCYVGTHLADAS